jgi:hypothetical protein
MAQRSHILLEVRIGSIRRLGADGCREEQGHGIMAMYINMNTDCLQRDYTNSELSNPPP